MSGPPFKILSVCKGGGYRYCRTDPPHPNANAMGLYPLHRVIVENREGRLLGYDDVVHHIDEDTSNDAIENLGLMTRSEHAIHHAADRPVTMVSLRCPVCLSGFTKVASAAKKEMRLRVDGLLCCSRRCGVRKMVANMAALPGRYAVCE